MPEFLPISRADMTRRGWDQCDFVYIIGDGYVDHPSVSLRLPAPLQGEPLGFPH